MHSFLGGRFGHPASPPLGERKGSEAPERGWEGKGQSFFYIFFRGRNAHQVSVASAGIFLWNHVMREFVPTQCRGTWHGTSASWWAHLARNRETLSDTPILRDMRFGVSQCEGVGCDSPAPSIRVWSSMPQVHKGYFSDTCAIPHQSKENYGRIKWRAFGRGCSRNGKPVLQPTVAMASKPGQSPKFVYVYVFFIPLPVALCLVRVMLLESMSVKSRYSQAAQRPAAPSEHVILPSHC